jgi:2-desacetyl-2-hydroxyethyl bacteriochlorophyllide A dehydrogenase
MRAGLLVAPETIEIRQIAQPNLARGEVLIRPTRIGICGSDVTFYLGHREANYPHVLGHELVGEVIAVAEDVSKFRAGQRVVVEPNYPCGTCRFCLSGRGRICPNKKSMGVNLPGCFADYVAAPAEFVWTVPDNIPDQDAAAIEPLAVALHALSQSDACMGDTVAVVGCGAIGLLLIHAAARQGIRVLAHDKIPQKLQHAARLGAITFTGADETTLWKEQDVSVVFECGGTAKAVELCLSAVPRGRRVLLLGMAMNQANFAPFRFVREGIRLESSLIYDHPIDFARAIALVESGHLQPSCVITETFPLESLGHALQLASTGRTSKVALTT